jgi:hypothetical protein
MATIWHLGSVLALFGTVVLISGCATAVKTDTQQLDILLKLPDGSSRVSAVCVLSNSAMKVTGNAPMFSVEVQRSSSDLQIDCRSANGMTGQAIAVSRMQTNGVGAVLAGMTGHVIDHMTGKLYDYPRRIEVVLGRKRVFDFSSGLVPVADAPLPGAALAQSAADAARVIAE